MGRIGTKGAPQPDSTSSDPGRWQVRLLGAVTVECDGEPRHLGPPKQTALLAILALHVGEIVSTDRLIEMLWDGQAPRTAAHSVQIYVSGLRRLLGNEAGAPVIETRPPGYRLALDPRSVDANRFEEEVVHARALLREGESERARATLRHALTLWRGEPLADLAYAEFVQPFIRQLSRGRREATEELAAAELAAGQVTEALVHAEPLAMEDPLGERAVELSMIALYRTGHHVSALRLFQRHRDALAEVGVLTSPRLQRLNEQILLHDPTLHVDGAPLLSPVPAPVRNPYKGLRPFTEADASDYFGRDALVDAMVQRLRHGARLLAIVGPSGCGKSSAVAAGLVPRLRAGAVPGSETWWMASLVPGPHPLVETNAVMARAAAGRMDTGPSTKERASLRRPLSATLLVLDQFEELFMAADPTSQRRYLDALTDAIAAPTGLTVVLTLRADFYDRPLLHERFAGIFGGAVLNVVPMTAAEINAAVIGPAAAEGIRVESELVSELVADTVGQPGSLPLMQYALADQMDRAPGGDLRLDDYLSGGGVRGALARRADEVFESLTVDQQRTAQQVLLRMVRVGTAGAEGCRRVPMAELAGLALDPVALSELLERFVRHRLLAVGSDAVTGGATVGVAHEALLTEWEQLSDWVERHRVALRRQETLRAAADEWEASGHHPDYLLVGTRLRDARQATVDAAVSLTSSERALIAASAARHDAEIEAEAAERRSHRHQTRRARRRLVALAAACSILGVSLAIVLALGEGVHKAALFYPKFAGELPYLIEAGYDQAVSRLGFVSSTVNLASSDADVQLDALAADHDVVVVFHPAGDIDTVARAHPDTRFVVLDGSSTGHNVVPVTFAHNEGAYLAGAAAALRSTTGTLGFIGGVEMDGIWQFQAGFEAGARAVDPDVRFLTTYLSTPGDFMGGFADPAAGERAARAMYQQGADVVFPAAGSSGLGVFEAAAEMSTPGRHLWAIGVDSDQFVTLIDLPGTVDAGSWTDHILTSMVKRWDRGIDEALQAAADGDAAAPIRLGLAEGGVDIAYSGGYIDDIRPRIEELREAIVAGTISVPCRPVDRPRPGPSHPTTCDADG